MELKKTEVQVELAQYNPVYDDQLAAFHLNEEQHQFTSMPLEKLNHPKLSANAKHIVILDNRIPVGYFALEEGEKLAKYSQNQRAILLTSFSINSKYQGKGIAKAALKLLPGFITGILPDVNEVVLGVNKRNGPAINLYKKLGFVDHNEIYIGPKGPQHILHLKLC
ncbi:GNAT family N-acetyltransferase [Jeotgalibacillus proteolyticus]|uniref:GNAT family N-acetyltransferase n=1 Tax=Jeotgalibacillus proteolyticus TaxID=2082395 RepID=A0A2S5G8R3_9BACL|nr:GNAT family N-acetyltransferase [Jeotgalibacillus proteolyticus]PPA69369.1 GNAT family N-acetyltransferase [Jeotgalibacillus proteolyticus]